jgi:two-component system, OmpR family, alkaline phosphatase synthesis response regulator PhoP
MKSNTVLVVEDEYASAEMLKYILEMHGFEVRLASNGQEALESLARETPALILSDVMMPLVDGRELCRRVRANPSFRGIPVVLMSAAHQVVKPDCAAAFLSKPLDFDLLIETIGHLIAADPANLGKCRG